MTTNYVWVLTEETPFEGSAIIDVFSSDHTRLARSEYRDHGEWRKVDDTRWDTYGGGRFNVTYELTRMEVR